MSGNGKALPFPAPAGTPILGQPFTLANLSIPVNATLTCNCGAPDTALPIVASAPVTCPGCRKVYAVAFNPANGQLMVAMSDQEAEKVPS